MIRGYPSSFFEEEGISVVGQMTLDEVKRVLNGFEKAKSLGPDG